MKRILTIFILLLSRLISFAQFAIITDKNGFVNLRKSPELGNNVVDKIPNGEIVFCLEGDGTNFRQVDYIKNWKTISGFIHSSRLIYIGSYKEIEPNIRTSESLIFKIAGTNITLTISDFDTKKNKLEFSNNMPKFLERINGKEIWGTDGNIPKKEYGQILLRTGNSLTKLPKENLFEPNFGSTKANFDIKSNTIYLTASNSDGAGGYEVIWVVRAGEFSNHVITTGF